MSFCEKCISYDMCKFYQEIISNEFITFFPNNEDCPYFKNEADFVEVVRCKDCKRCYEKRTKRNNQLMRFCMRMDGNEYQVNANDFCSYGIPKERGVRA